MPSNLRILLNAIQALKTRVQVLEEINRAHEADKAGLEEREKVWRNAMKAMDVQGARLEQLTHMVERLDGELELTRCGEATQREVWDLEK